MNIMFGRVRLVLIIIKKTFLFRLIISKNWKHRWHFTRPYNPLL